MHAWLRRRQSKPGAVVRRYVSSARRAELRRCFEALDTDGSGSIDREEVTFALEQLGLSPQHAQAILNEGDSNGDSAIDFDEFVALVGAVSAREHQRAALREPKGRAPAKVAKAFTQMIDQAAAQYPLGLLANAHHIQMLVTGFDPDNYAARGPHANDSAHSDVRAPVPSHGPNGGALGGGDLKKLKLPPAPRARGADVQRASSAPTIKSTSHSRWLARANTAERHALRTMSAGTLDNIPERGRARLPRLHGQTEPGASELPRLHSTPLPPPPPCDVTPPGDGAERPTEDPSITIHDGGSIHHKVRPTEDASDDAVAAGIVSIE